MASSVEDDRRNWAELPREVTASIFSRLMAVDILTSAQFVCKSWLEVSKDPLAWKVIDMVMDDDDAENELNLDKICRRAVDRSCGQAVEIRFENFGDVHLLKYVTERSNQIKRLWLVTRCSVSEEGLIEAVDRLPLLEELELTRCYYDAETLEDIGRKCPRLKSFKLNSVEHWFCQRHCDDIDVLDEEAIAIGKHMAGLKSLQLVGNPLTNFGLDAILEGCPGLESLDLRKCVNVSLDGEEGEVCRAKVKQLRHPKDSTKDLPYNQYRVDDDEVTSQVITPVITAIMKPAKPNELK